MKTAIRIFSLIIAALLTSCLNTSKNPIATVIQNPGVQAQVLGDVEKDVIATGGALLLSGGNSGAAVAALSKQELDNLPGLKTALQNATPATVIAAPATLPVPAAASATITAP